MCTSIFWNTNPDLLIVGRNEDYITASHPTLVVTPRGVKRRGSSDPAKADSSASWTVEYGNVAVYANNRFPNDGLNEAGLTARTLYYIQGSADELVAPDSDRKELDEDHWVSFVLDRFATVADAVAALQDEVYLVSVTGQPGSGFSYATPKHLTLADATGDSAVVELQDGQLKVFHGPQYRILTNPPSYQDELANVAKYQDAAQEDLPVSWSGADRFVRADYFLRHLPVPENNDAATGYGFMYSILGSCAMPAGLPTPAEDREVTKHLLAALTDPNESYGGASTYFQSISDLTNRHFRFKSLLAPSDVYVNLADCDLSEGAPVLSATRVDLYAQQGWGANALPHLQPLDGDVYDEEIV